MPGIYINDGGSTASSIGSVLGNLATSLSPEAAAQAQLLQQQTLGANLGNQIKAGVITGATGIPSIVGSANAEPVAPTGTVASTAAGLAQPPGPAPGTFGAGPVNAGFAPMARVIAGSFLNNPDMTNLTAGINLGKDITTGAGTDYATGNTEHIAQHAPAIVAPGQTRINDPTLGLTPGNVITGGSPYDQTVADTMGKSDPTNADHLIQLGADANVNIGKTQGILDAYNKTVAPEFTPGGILSERGAMNAAAYLHLPIPDILKMGAPGVKDMIRKQFTSMVSNLRDNLGNPIIKGSLDTIMSQFPDADSSPEQFRAAIQALMTTLQQQKADGEAALNWKAHPTQQGYVDLLRQEYQHAAEARGAFASAGLTGDGGESGDGKKTDGGGGGGGGQIYVFPDEASMDAAGAAGIVKPGQKVVVGGKSGTYQPKVQ